MEQPDIERIIRGVITDLAAPYTLVKVERTSLGWHAMVKHTPGRRVVSVRLPDGPPPAIRTTVMHLIEAELHAED